jgi:hypothetical protein
MKWVMEPLGSLCLQEHFLSKQRSSWTRVNHPLILGLHPLKISDGFDLAVDIATKKLEEISQ